MGDEESILIEYRAKNGEILVYDIGSGALKPFGFNYADRVDTPKGPASVIGVREGCMWFHCDCDLGASFWDNGKSYEDLRTIGISVIEVVPMVIDLTEKNGVYKLKRISYKDRNINVILQNENGPCPLISISNALALRGDITISPAGEPDTSRCIDIELIKSLLEDLLRSRYANASEEVKTQVTKSIEQLPNLQMGMDVNVGFLQPDSFEKTDQSRIFDLLGVPLVHGWLVDPIDKETFSVIGNNTYNDLMNKLVALDQPPAGITTAASPHPSHPASSSPPASQSSPSSQPTSVSSQDTSSASQSSAPSPSQDSTPSSKSLSSSSPQDTHLSPSVEKPTDSSNAELKKVDDVKPPTAYDGEIINAFLLQTSSQLTAHGLSVLYDTLKEDELCVFFRNNHFSTLTRHGDYLYILVTDIGYEKERIIVWDLINSVDGNSLFVTGDFKPTDDEKKDEIINTLEIMGWTRTRIEECMKQAPREKLVNADDAISYLAQMLGPSQVV
jgi:hypothetical protein